MDKPRSSPAAPILETRRRVMRIVSESERRLTPIDVEKTLRARFKTDKTICRAALKSLLEDNEIVYAYLFGASFIQKSMNRPVRVSTRVVLTPPGMACRASAGEAVVSLNPGASFGSGDHPSTRLAVRGVDRALGARDPGVKSGCALSLDIGTGSGVLAIVAASLGPGRAIGIDRDPNALWEARQNVRANRLEHRIEISDRGVETIGQKFSLIMANLRTPTLGRLVALMHALLAPDGCIVVSGVRVDETRDLARSFNRAGLGCTWKETEKGWAGLAFERGRPVLTTPAMDGERQGDHRR